MVYGNMGKPRYVVRYVWTIWDGKNTVWYVCDMVPWYDVVVVIYG